MRSNSVQLHPFECLDRCLPAGGGRHGQASLIEFENLEQLRNYMYKNVLTIYHATGTIRITLLDRKVIITLLYNAENEKDVPSRASMQWYPKIVQYVRHLIGSKHKGKGYT